MTDGPVLVALDPANLEGQRHLLARAEAEAAQRGTRLEAILVIEAPRHAGTKPGFAAQVVAGARTPLYRAVGLLLAGAVPQLRPLLTAVRA